MFFLNQAQHIITGIVITLATTIAISTSASSAFAVERSNWNSSYIGRT